MKPLFSLSATALTILLALPAAADTIRSNGHYLYAFRSNADYRLSLYATETANGPGYLQYYLTRCSPFDCQEVAFGYGPLPEGALSVQKNGTGTLQVPDVAQLPGFTRSGLSVGSLNVSFERDGSYTYSSTGTRQVRAPGFRQMTNGATEFGYVILTGSVLGFAVPANGNAEAGTSRNVTVTTDRTP
jgi:hypothetical protein